MGVFLGPDVLGPAPQAGRRADTHADAGGPLLGGLGVEGLDLGQEVQVVGGCERVGRAERAHRADDA